jgi:hypothetical protein
MRCEVCRREYDPAVVTHERHYDRDTFCTMTAPKSAARIRELREKADRGPARTRAYPNEME